MVTLDVAGGKVGTLADAGRVIAEHLTRESLAGFRDGAGEVVGRFLPAQKPTPAEPLVPWDPTITREDIEPRCGWRSCRSARPAGGSGRRRYNLRHRPSQVPPCPPPSASPSSAAG